MFVLVRIPFHRNINRCLKSWLVFSTGDAKVGVLAIWTFRLYLDKEEELKQPFLLPLWDSRKEYQQIVCRDHFQIKLRKSLAFDIYKVYNMPSVQAEKWCWAWNSVLPSKSLLPLHFIRLAISHSSFIVFFWLVITDFSNYLQVNCMCFQLKNCVHIQCTHSPFQL